jgi:hypothetical protein
MVEERQAGELRDCRPSDLDLSSHGFLGSITPLFEHMDHFMSKSHAYIAAALSLG